MKYSFQEIAFFKNASPEFLNTLHHEHHAHTYNKGQVIFIHEDHAESFFLIQNGWVKLFRETLDGTQSVVDILNADNIFGETAIFNNTTYPYSAEAIEPTKIISLPINALQKEIENNNKFALDMMHNMALHRRLQDKEIEHRTIQNAPQRIGCFLLRLIDQSTLNATQIHLPYDKTLVAARLGMQPETFSRALTKLKDKTDLDVKGATITINSPKRLSDYVCAACSSEFPCKDISVKTAIKSYKT